MRSAAWLALFASSCAAPDLDPALADMASWLPATRTDPLASHRPADDACPPGGYSQENFTFEVDTGACRYGFFEQPLLQDVDAGQAVEVVFWHADLAAVKPADAHLALLIDDTTVWERTMPIPSPACVYADVFEVPHDAPAGAALQLHLHNHGANTWNLRRVDLSDESATVTPPCEDTPAR